MSRTWSIQIPDEFHVNIQDLFKIEGGGRAGMAKLAAIIIDESYGKMKTNFPSTQHHCSEKQPLYPINLEYAAVDGFVTYDLYCRIKLMMKGIRHLQQKL